MSISVQPVVNPYPMANNLVHRPRVPFFGTLSPISPGLVIVISGRVPHGCRRFEFNLMAGSVITESLKTSGDIAFHFNPRFDSQLVVRNSRHSHQWGPEEREPQSMPYVSGQPFETMILVEQYGYKVAVNGRHFCEFIHRIPLACVGVFAIDGTVDIERIEYRREVHYMPQPAPPVIINQPLVPILSPPVPYHHRFVEPIRPGLMLYISGRLTNSPNKFAIDFNCGQHPHQNDTAFHFNPRLETKQVVRNHCQGGRWGHEERQAPNFPFHPGVNFDLIVRLDQTRYMVAINGQHFIEFKHRIPLQFVNEMVISGDIIVNSIRFSQS